MFGGQGKKRIQELHGAAASLLGAPRTKLIYIEILVTMARYKR
jgi:hypothetical protein